MKKRILNISLILALMSTGSVFAQQGFGTNTPDKSAAVDITSSNKGLLIPRMDLTWEANAIKAPVTATPIAQGLLVYNKTAVTNVPEGFYYFSAGKWNPIGVSVLQDGDNTTVTGTGTASDPYKVKVTNLAGDVTGDVLTNKVVKIQGTNVSATVPTTGQVLKEISGTWTPSTLVGSDISDAKTISATSPVKVNNTASVAGATLKDVSITVDKASNTQLGVVQIGSNINVDADGVISVNFPDGTVDTNTITTISSKTDQTYVTVDQSQTAGLPGDVINTRDYKIGVNKATSTTLGVVMPGTGMNIDTDGKLNVTAVADVLTNLSQNASGISYTNEAGTAQNAKVVSANTDNLITTGTDFGAFLGKSTVQSNQVKYEVVDGLNTDASLDVANSTADLQKYKVDVATANGKTLGVVREAETNPTVNVSNGDLSINLTNTILAGEVTGPLNANIVADNVIDAANLKTDAVTTVKITDANVTPIKIQPANQYTQTQVMVTGTDGVVKWVDQSTISPATSVLNVSPDNTLVTTVNGVSSTSVNLVKNVELSLAGKSLTTKVNGVSNTTALDLSSIDTDAQQLSLTGNTLKLERSTPDVDLTKYDTKLVAGTNTTVSGDGSTTPYAVNVNFPTIDGSETVVTAGTNVSVTGSGTTASPYIVSSTDTNTDEQQLSLTGNTLTLTNSSPDVDLGKYLDNTDNQQLSYEPTTNVLSLTDGGTVNLSALATDTNTVTTAKADAAQSYVKVVSTPASPGTADREYTIGVDAATAQFDTTTPGTTTETTPGTSGVVKPGKQFKVEVDGHLTVKYAMPQFFYMPSILIDTSTANPAPVDLYAAYTAQFGMPLVSSANAEAGGIPTLPAKELDFYVTYYDNTVISGISIDADGKMTYTVGGAPTNLSFVNVVFKVRKESKP